SARSHRDRAVAAAPAGRRRRRRSREHRQLRVGQRSRAFALPSHRGPLRRRPRTRAAAVRWNARDTRVHGGAAMINVLLVDDHELLRAGLRSRLEGEPGITVVGEADTADRAILLARRLQPDVILLDIILPRKSGYEAIPELAEAAPGAKILVVSSQAAPSSVRRALSAGAAGYLPKRSSDRELVAAIQIIAEGGGYVQPSLGARLVNDPSSPALEALSERERDIVHL